MERVTLSTGEMVVCHQAGDVESLVVAHQFETMRRISQSGGFAAMMARRQLGKSCARYTDRVKDDLAGIFASDVGDMVLILTAILRPSDSQVLK